MLTPVTPTLADSVRLTEDEWKGFLAKAKSGDLG